MVKIACISQTCSTDKNENISKSIAAIEQAAHQGVELIVLQELHTTRYFCQTESSHCFDLAETIPGPTLQTYLELSQRLGVLIITSLFEKRLPGLHHNTAVAVDRGEILGQYRKMHIPDDPGYYEKYYFTPGDSGFNPIVSRFGKIGILICWDQWFPEAARLMALAGAELLVYPTAIGWDQSDTIEEQQRQLDAWITVQRGHAIANGLPVVTCNRVGFEPEIEGSTKGIQFWGNSFIAGPQGEILTQADSESATTLTADIDLKHCENIRRQWPFLRDRRIDTYGNLLKLAND